MYTQCTNCKTLFRITEEQLAAVNGKVRCGFCYSTFNALDALYEEIPETTEDELTEEAFAEDEATAAANFESADNNTPSNEYEERIAQIDPLSRNTGRAREDFDAPQVSAREQAPSYLPATARPQTEFSATRRPSPPPPRAERKQEPPPRARNEQRRDEDHPARNESPTQESKISTLPNLLEVIDTAGKDLQQVSRVELDRLRQPRPDLAPQASSIGWGLGIVVLVAALAAQYAFNMRNELARFPSARPWLETSCQWFNCSIPMLRAPKLVELISKEMRSHPNAKNALQVRARAVNNAPYTQAYPLLRLDITDIAGEFVGSRVFRPDEYLADTSATISAGITTHGQFDIQLELVDEKKMAVGYNFTFL